MENVIEFLLNRGVIDKISDPALIERVKTPISLYCGFDPSADSLHVGNLIPLMGLKWFSRFGHKAYPLIGGATGLIGDPSGKTKERNFISQEQVTHNEKGISSLISFLMKDESFFEIVNNKDWYAGMTVIDFLRDVGVYFRLGPMLGKESVRLRMESEEGMSFTEFCYQVLQGYDFFHLYKILGIELELGGGDQWGNITAGIEATRKMAGAQVFGASFPLLLRSDGKKFGKSEGGAIFLSKDKVSPYHFYQYFIAIPDKDVPQMMRLLTFLDGGEIAHWERELASGVQEPFAAQKVLARCVTEIVHGEGGLLEALEATASLQPGKDTALDIENIERLKNTILVLRMKKKPEETSILDLLVEANLCKSKGEARRLIQNKGVYVNNNTLEEEVTCLQKEMLLETRYILLAAGKKKKVLLDFF